MSIVPRMRVSFFCEKIIKRKKRNADAMKWKLSRKANAHKANQKSHTMTNLNFHLLLKLENNSDNNNSLLRIKEADLFQNLN